MCEKIDAIFSHFTMGTVPLSPSWLPDATRREPFALTDEKFQIGLEHNTSTAEPPGVAATPNSQKAREGLVSWGGALKKKQSSTKKFFFSSPQEPF